MTTRANQIRLQIAERSVGSLSLLALLRWASWTSPPPFQRPLQELLHALPGEGFQRLPGRA
jgi:hypothetical protein